MLTLLIDKPEGWTSFDVVAKIRGHIRAQYAQKGEKPTKKQLKVGHAGTLDPFATGLLIILIGEATKKADEFLKLDKTYEFTAQLGEVSSTGDPEGVITPYTDGHSDLTHSKQGENKTEQGELALQKSRINNQESRSIPTKEAILAVLENFTGEIIQTPPAYSAIKIDGKRAYKLAREGKEVAIPSRKVTISRLELVEYDYPTLKCICDVSSGTYIRSLAEDIGKSLGTGAYCKELRRTRIGTWHIEEAQDVEAVTKQV